jgi:hypothetical protein
VQEAGGGDQHGVDVAVVERLFGIGQGHCARDALDGGLRTSKVDVDDGGNFGTVDALVEALDVRPAPMTATRRVSVIVLSLRFGWLGGR